MKVKVMVTGVGGGGHGEQILKALRLASTEYEIVGSDMSPLSKGLQDIDYQHLTDAILTASLQCVEDIEFRLFFTALNQNLR